MFALSQESFVCFVTRKMFAGLPSAEKSDKAREKPDLSKNRPYVLKEVFPTEAWARPRESLPQTTGSIHPTYQGLPLEQQQVKITLEESSKSDIIEYGGSSEKYPFFQAQVSEARKSGRYSETKILVHLKSRLKGRVLTAVNASLLTGGNLDSVLDII